MFVIYWLVYRFKTEDEAVAVANNTSAGLAGTVSLHIIIFISLICSQISELLDLVAEQYNLWLFTHETTVLTIIIY